MANLSSLYGILFNRNTEIVRNDEQTKERESIAVVVHVFLFLSLECRT